MATPLDEIVFELSPSDDRHGVGGATAALLELPGVHEAHIDPHRTWAMVGFDPAVTTVAAITGCLGAHGLDAHRMRRLADPLA